MSKHTDFTSGALALCLLAAFSQHAHAGALDAKQDGKQDGMVVVRDAQTGKLRAPTPDEAKALRARTPAAGLAPLREPSVTTRRDGARGVRLGEKTMVYEVVTRSADGSLSSQCVHGDGAAQDALTRPARQEHKEHDHETR
ncbi:post-PEP-CTERM-1 domain-containing protein [Massilia sp. TN1-12]|uniref:post-PEP-CTERM-1 domain-containing protein n=1 Tax=Massilia paldalensis TaxID=3377675 RepID=UPI00384A6C14